MRKFKKHKTKSSINIDQILSNHNIDYSDIDFENKETDILKSFNNLNSQINKSSNYFKNLRSLIPFFNYKAILKPAYTIVLTTIVIFAVIEFKKLNKDIEYAEITVDEGEKITLHITDNFTIWLNSETTIRIPMELNRNAKIFLDGEAYFEIKNRNKKIPEIIANNIIFKTKQGAFNINSRYNSNQLVSTIKEGNIEIYNPNMPKSTTLIVHSGEKVTYNPIAEFIAVEKENNINYLAWKTGILNFDNTNLNEVSEIIACFYGIPIQVENPDLQYKKFTASFNNADIDEILDKLQITFNCEISGDGSKLVIN